MKALSKRPVWSLALGLLLLLSACFPAGAETETSEDDELATSVAATLTAQAPISEATATQPEAGPTPTEPGGPTATTASENTTLTVSVDTNCRGGPGLAYLRQGGVLVGEVAEVVGRPPSGDDYAIINNLDKPGEVCWLWLEYATVEGPWDSLPIVQVPEIPMESSIGGLVWLDLCSAPVLGDPPPPPGCVKLEGGGYAANGTLDSGEAGIAGVVVDLGEGPCPATGLATATTNSSGQYSFLNLAYGTYCVSIDPLAHGNDSLLIPGGWTYPNNAGEVTVELDAGEDETGVNFGWDFQLD